MAITRSGQSSATSTPSSSQKAANKRKAEATSPPQISKRGKIETENHQNINQKTLEEVLEPQRNRRVTGRNRVNGNERPAADDADDHIDESSKTNGDIFSHPAKGATNKWPRDKFNADLTEESDILKEHDHVDGSHSNRVDPTAQATKDGNVTPSSVLEKGLIYFFLRGRVGIDDPSDVGEVARSYIVMRPLPHDGELGKTSINSESASFRVLALPKKVLPKTAKDRFMVFVECAKATAGSIRDNILKSADYETKSAGRRHTPAAKPIAEGVYVLISASNESHLAYILTLPEKLSEVQRDLGLREEGSFIVSAKNPQYGGPASATLPKAPEFSREIISEFRALRWTPLQPKMLDYENAQMLLIGTNATAEKLPEALDSNKNDSESGKNKPSQELHRLEDDDELRVRSLQGDEAQAIFDDLKLNQEEFSTLQTTW